jgi:hypothetical protein
MIKCVTLQTPLALHKLHYTYYTLLTTHFSLHATHCTHIQKTTMLQCLRLTELFFVYNLNMKRKARFLTEGVRWV